MAAFANCHVMNCFCNFLQESVVGVVELQLHPYTTSTPQATATIGMFLGGYLETGYI